MVKSSEKPGKRQGGSPDNLGLPALPGERFRRQQRLRWRMELRRRLWQLVLRRSEGKPDLRLPDDQSSGRPLPLHPEADGLHVRLAGLIRIIFFMLLFVMSSLLFLLYKTSFQGDTPCLPLPETRRTLISYDQWVFQFERAGSVMG